MALSTIVGCLSNYQCVFFLLEEIFYSFKLEALRLLSDPTFEKRNYKTQSATTSVFSLGLVAKLKVLPVSFCLLTQ